MDIYLLNELQKLEAGNSSAPTSGNMYLPQLQDLPQEDAIIPMITRTGQRQAAYPNSWTSSYGGTTFYTYNSDSHSQRTRFWMASGGARKDANAYNEAEGTATEVVYANNNRVGVCKSHTSMWSGSSYAPWRTSIIFIKNKGTTNKNVNLYYNMTNYYASGHDGGSLTEYVPNTSTLSSVSSISMTNLWSYTSNSTNATNSSTRTISAGRTNAYVIANSMYYHQDTNSNASWHDGNGFYNLSTTFSDPDIVPDLEMTQTYLMMRHHTSAYTDDPKSVWNATALYFPETP